MNAPARPNNRYAGIILLGAGLCGVLFYGSQRVFGPIALAYSAAFAGYIILLRNQALSQGTGQWIIPLFAFKALGFVSLPNLTNDIYRFWWDGFLSLNGINPFRYTPTEALLVFKDQPNIYTHLNNHYGQLNSPDYYSVYPVFCQGLFMLSAAVAKSNIILFHKSMFALFLLADAITYFALRSLRRYLQLPSSAMVFVLANPLYIVEGLYNLHFELWIITFLTLSVWLILRKRYTFSGLVMGCAIVCKLNPLLLAPYMVKATGNFHRQYRFTAGLVLPILLLIPLLHHHLPNYTNALNLYVQRFEFNSPLYRPLTYLCEKMHWWELKNFAGYLLLALFLMLYFALLKDYWITGSRQISFLFTGMWMTCFLFLLCSSTVHPWYVMPLIFLGLFTSFRNTTLIFSLLVILSYAWYDPDVQTMSIGLRAVEYILVALSFLIELRDWLAMKAYLK